MKAGLVGFPCGALAAYVVCALVGAAVQPVLGPSMSTTEAAAALAFSFRGAGSEPGAWYDPSGNASHSWIFRRAFVTGHLGSDSGTAYSEQVLKVGWPFTVARGFIRTVGPEMSQEGARVMGAAKAGLPTRMLPTQPVWPGVVFFGLVGAIGFTAISRRSSPAPGPPAVPS